MLSLKSEEDVKQLLDAIIIIWREKSSVKLILRSLSSKSPTQREFFAS